jgi:regulator of protease activity HflC (stomatin/prohibitin superfamily)
MDDERAGLLRDHGNEVRASPRLNHIPGLPFSLGDLIGGLILIFVIIVPVCSSWFVVPPGEIGVVVTLGHVTSYGRGLHWRIPYASHVVMMSAKTQKLDETNTVPTKEGLSVQLDTAMYVHFRS